MLRSPWCLLPAGLLFTSTVLAAPALRVQVDQQGDFILIGNTLTQECAPGTPVPVVGVLQSCGTNTADSAGDVFWLADFPGAGQAQANSTITVAQARSTAVLNLPSGANVTHAYLYWSATLDTPSVDNNVVLERPDVFTQAINAISTYQSANNSYLGVADITALVQANGSGAYRVSGVDIMPLVDQNNSNLFGVWYMVVLYQRAGDPLRNLAVFDGLDLVSSGNAQNVFVSGFVVPPAGFTGKLGVVGLEGDNTLTGDQLFFNGGAALSDGQNPAINFFNGTRSNLGTAVGVAGDLPQLTGTPQSLTGMDLDVLDVTAKLTGGQTSAGIQASSTGDVFFLATLVTSISAYRPMFNTSSKTVVDVNGGATLPGDELLYSITVNNTGNDGSFLTVLQDTLPPEVSFVPGTIAVLGAPQTDVPGDDLCEFAIATNAVVCRLGTAANATVGGVIPPGASTAVSFHVTVQPGVAGQVSNQAVINAGGLVGAPAADTPTDGNPGVPGPQPTVVQVDQCNSDALCPPGQPYCAPGSPRLCVACLMDAHCAAPTPTCDPGTNTCVCVPTGQELCNNLDDDCNGAVDEGFNLGSACNVGLGICQATGVLVCVDPATSACDAVPGPPAMEICGDALDSDCEGDPNNGCADTDADGLFDDVEVMLGSSPTDADSDDDGLLDGQETFPAGNLDTDPLVNILDPDSDGDGLWDGTENGLDCANPATDPGAGHCTPDADLGLTVTNHLEADTDHGGMEDGAEDANLDGVVGAGERDPLAPLDDTLPCVRDGECGLPQSGQVCVLNACVPGCRGMGGNMCPAGFVCSSADMNVGSCDGVDAGVPADAGSGDAAVDGDAGVAADAGTTSDGGAAVDASMVDGAVTTPDGAVVTVDGGTGNDAGNTRVDAGARDGGGNTMDGAVATGDAGGSGATPDAGGGGDNGGGCGCRANSTTDTAAGPAGLAVLLALAVRRSRRRNAQERA